MNRRLGLPLGLVLLGLWGTAQAANPPPCAGRPDAGTCQSERRETVLGPGQAHSLSAEDLRQATIWGLTELEWRRYQELKASYRQFWSPNLDPLETLGVHAETEAERRRYAELKAQLEHDRVEKELAFERAYQAAFQRLYPSEPLVDYQGKRRWSDVLQNPGPKRLPFFAPKRLLFFAPLECPDCRPRLVQLLAKTPMAPLDIYLTGTGGDDAKARAWAQRMGIPPTEVQAGRVTLNHERGELARLRLTGQALPLALLRQGDGTLKALPAGS